MAIFDAARYFARAAVASKKNPPSAGPAGQDVVAASVGLIMRQRLRSAAAELAAEAKAKAAGTKVKTTHSRARSTKPG
jgi:hypothetical protein